MMSGLRVTGLTKSFGKKVVIDNVSFEVEEGEFAILLGPSGCGKSTILRLVAGLEHQDAGDVAIGGTVVNDLPPRARDIAMVFQSYALYPHLSVFENLAFPLRIGKHPRAEIEQKVGEAARLLGIEDLLQRKPAQLSGGQRQRVAMGRALVREPRIFLFDEPLSNLDAKLRAAMRVELAALHRKLGITMLYVTHDQVEAMTLGDTIILLDEGSIQQVGPPRELYGRPKNIFAATFIGSPQINLLHGTAREDGAFASSVLVLANAGLADYAGNHITLGIRPEALAAGDGPLSGSIELVEHIGSESLVHFMAGDSRLVARAEPDFEGRPGEKISFSLDTRSLHYFHNGTRIPG
jgi:multiple sugar transport system ATP-binding protein